MSEVGGVASCSAPPGWMIAPRPERTGDDDRASDRPLLQMLNVQYSLLSRRAETLVLTAPFGICAPDLPVIFPVCKRHLRSLGWVGVSHRLVREPCSDSPLCHNLGWWVTAAGPDLLTGIVVVFSSGRGRGISLYMGENMKKVKQNKRRQGLV